MGIASGMREITQAIVSSHEERTKRVEEVKKEAQGLIEDFQTSRKQMGSELRKELAQSRAALKEDTQKLIDAFRSSRREMGSELRKELHQGVDNRKSEVKTLLGDFQSSRREMGATLRKDLAKGSAERKSEVKTLLGDFQSSRRQMGAQLRKDLAQDRTDRKSEVEKARAEVKADLKEAHDAWQEVVSKRKVKAAPEAEEVPDWEEKLLTAVNEHPDGITLAEAAESLGIAPVVLGRAAKSLIDKGRIRKERKLYFPVESE